MSATMLAAALALAGAGFGFAFFTTLHQVVLLYCADRSRCAAAGLTIARLVAAVLFFSAAARFGAMPLLAALLGFLAARTFAARSIREPR